MIEIEEDTKRIKKEREEDLLRWLEIQLLDTLFLITARI